MCIASAILTASLSLTGTAHSQSAFAPSAVFSQIGTGEDTQVVTFGLAWDWSRPWSVAGGELGGYWELSASGWSYPSTGGRGTAWLAQVGVVPTFRFRPDSGQSPWFAELGIGASLMTNLYETNRKRFSTEFNFADHIAIGRNFGDGRRHEIALRLEHFSNAGIKHPNPGANFVEVRYTHRFPGL